MSQWIERILSRFTADLDRLWVACDPDDVLLDERLLAELRSRGFEASPAPRPLWSCTGAAQIPMSCLGTLGTMVVS